MMGETLDRAEFIRSGLVLLGAWCFEVAVSKVSLFLRERPKLALLLKNRETSGQPNLTLRRCSCQMTFAIDAQRASA